MAPNIRMQQIASKMALFRGLAPEDVAKIFARGMTMQVSKGEVIFKKGTTGSQMYVVLGGKVAIFDGQKQIASLSVGDMFGEMALISSEPRSATAVAEEASHLYVLNETTFQRLMTKRVAIRILLNVIGTLSQRLREVNKRLA